MGERWEVVTQTTLGCGEWGVEMVTSESSASGWHLKPLAGAPSGREWGGEGARDSLGPPSI